MSDDLDRYNLTSEQITAVEDLFTGALAEAGYVTVESRNGWALSPCPDDVWVKACNIIRCVVGVDQFPDVDTWRRWNHRSKS